MSPDPHDDRPDDEPMRPAVDLTLRAAVLDFEDGDGRSMPVQRRQGLRIVGERLRGQAESAQTLDVLRTNVVAYDDQRVRAIIFDAHDAPPGSCSLRRRRSPGRHCRVVIRAITGFVAPQRRSSS